MSETHNAGAAAAQESAAPAVRTVTQTVEVGADAAANNSAFNSVDQAILAGSGNLNTESFGPQNPDARVEATMNNVSQMSSEDIHASLENVAELNDPSELTTEKPATAGDYRQQMEAILDNDALTPEERADQVRALQHSNQDEHAVQSSADASITETPRTEGADPTPDVQQTPSETPQAAQATEAPQHPLAPENNVSQTQQTPETPIARQTQEAATHTQPTTETPPPTNDQLVAQEARLQQQLNKGEITQEQYRNDMSKLAEQTGVDASQINSAENATINEPTADQRAEGAKVTENGESLELNAEQQARFEGMKLANELADIGVDPKSEAGQKLMIELAKDPSLMENLKLAKEGMTQLAEALGPEAAQQSAEASKDALEKQQAEAEAKGDRQKASKLKGLLAIMLALLAAGAFAVGGAAMVAAGQLEKK